mgnify:CR=1 FL=1
MPYLPQAMESATRTLGVHFLRRSLCELGELSTAEAVRIAKEWCGLTDSDKDTKQGWMNIQFDDWGGVAADRWQVMLTMDDDHQMHVVAATRTQALMSAVIAVQKAQDGREG